MKISLPLKVFESMAKQPSKSDKKTPSKQKPTGSNNPQQRLLSGKLLIKQDPASVKIGPSAHELQRLVLERTRELDEANHRIRQVRDLFYALFHANPIPTALIHMRDGVFLNVNTEFLSYFGLQRNEVIGHTAEELHIDLGLGALVREEFIDQNSTEGKIRNFEQELTLPSGEVRNIIASVQYINLDNTEALISTFIDITDRVKADRQVRILATQLTQAEQEERHRISEILHDDLQQRLFAVKAQLPGAEEAFKNQDLEGLQALLKETDEWLGEAISIMRNLSIDISPIILHGEGLADAIAWLSTQMQKQYNLNIVLQTNGIRTHFEKGVRVMLFQAVRELLFNVVKHSGTLEAEVSMERVDDRVLITVSDQGQGFDSSTVLGDAKVAHGLLSVRNRLDLLGCQMEINSKPGAGTRVSINCPDPKG